MVWYLSLPYGIDAVSLYAPERDTVRDWKEEVEMLFPLTYLIRNVENWSTDGVISHAKIEATNPIVSYLLLLLLGSKQFLCSSVMTWGLLVSLLHKKPRACTSGGRWLDALHLFWHPF